MRTKALRADLEKAISPDALKDLTSASLAKFKTGIEQANRLLKDSQWHLPDAVIEEYILDAIGAMELITCDQPMAYTWAERGEGETWYCEMPKVLKTDDRAAV